jgi:hypothetical protein
MRVIGSLTSGFRRMVARGEKPLYPLARHFPMMALFPDFMVIGAMKGATTWLYENLRCHPAAFLPSEKEDYFFSHDFRKRSLYSYLKRFTPGRHAVKGEITPGYSILPLDRIRLIHGFKPDLRLVFLARNPVDRAWSEAVMNLSDKTGRPLRGISPVKRLRTKTRKRFTINAKTVKHPSD